MKCFVVALTFALAAGAQDPAAGSDPSRLEAVRPAKTDGRTGQKREAEVAGNRCPIGGTFESLTTARGSLNSAPPSIVKSGVVIQSVDQDGFLDRNGFRVGDILAQIGTNKVESNDELLHWYETAVVNSHQRIDFWRPTPGTPGYRPLFVDAEVSAAFEDVGVAAYDGLDAPLKEEFIGKWREAIAEKHDKLAAINDRLGGRQMMAEWHRANDRNPSARSRLRKSDPNEQIKSLASQAQELRQELRKLFHNDPPFVPPLPDYQKGRIGQLAVCGVIFQKLSARRSLVIKIGNDPLDNLVLLEDCKFIIWKHKGKILKSADGFPYVNFPDTMEVTGTFRYRTPGGEIVTVPSLREYKWPHYKAATKPTADAEQAALPEPASQRRPVLAGHETAKPSAEQADTGSDEDALARKKLGGVLTNARKLAKAGLPDAARKNLKRILKEVPGTSIAKEAQQELDHLESGR